MSPPTFEFGRFSLDPAEHRLYRDGRPVSLTPRVFDLLRVLVQHAGHLVEKESLLKRVWNDTVVEEANLNRAISVLRRALGESPTERFIETVPKRGYRFVAEVRLRDRSGIAIEGSATQLPSSGSRLRAPVLAAVAVASTIAAGVAISVSLGPSRRVGEPGSNGASTHRQVTFTGREATPALSPDGSRIAYVSKDSTRRRVMVHELIAGRSAEVFSAPEAGALRWSPDGSELMFWARGDGTNGQYVVPASGGSARKVANGAFVGCWSPDGSTIALGLFVSGRILLLNRLGEVQRSVSLEGTQGWIWDLDWSPANGRLLIVADDDQGRPSLWTIRPDGGDQAKMFTGETEILAARWAPQGDAAYYFTRVNQTVSLYKAPYEPDRGASSGAPIPLITGLETDEGFGISADGARLVYARAPYFSNLWVVDSGEIGADGRARQTQLTQGTAVIERPRVSPDSRAVVFNMGYESRANLYTVPTDGGDIRQLTFLNAFSVDGAWSADGRSVAFASTEGGTARVWLVNADGSAPLPISARDMSEAFDVTWAPGPRILYQQSGNRNFYVLDPDKREERLLIGDASVGWSASAEYSPDGRKIAVSWNRRPSPGLWVIDADTSRETLVYGVRDPSETMPLPIGWSPDGRFIVAVDGRRAAYRGITAAFEETITEARIVRVPVGGGNPVTILPLTFDEVGSIAMFPDGRRFVVTVYSSRSDVWVVDGFDSAAMPPTAP